MATSYKVLQDGESGAWRVLSVTDKGETVKDKYDALVGMEAGAAVKVLLGFAKEAANKRLASVSLLGLILKDNEQRFDSWRGKVGGDAAIPNGCKETFRDLEKAFFSAFMDTKHSQHKAFIGNLPKADANGKPLHDKEGKLILEDQFEAFLNITRKDPSYSNAKNMVLGFLCYCGSLPYDSQGRIIPPEVIRYMVEAKRIRTVADTSFKARLLALRDELMGAEAKTPPDDDMPTILAAIKQMADMVQEMENIAAVRRTNRPQPGSVKHDTDEAIAKAQASTGLATPTATGKAKVVKEDATN